VGILLRKLDRLQAWDLDDRSSYPWLRTGEFQADPLSDLNSSNNKISVFEIDEDEANLTQVASALAAGRGQYDRFDYVLFPDSVVSGLDFRLVATSGNTPDEQVNGYHRNISELSAQRLVELVERIFRNKKRIDTVSERDLIECIIQGIRDGRVKHKLIRNQERLRERANKLGLEVPPDDN
jgi:hypothetical protein